MDWSGSYESTFRVVRVDRTTWESCGNVTGARDIEVDRDGTDDAPMLETATMRVACEPSEPFESGWLRIVMDAIQDGTSESVPIATLWFTASRGRYDKGYRADELNGLSALWQASGDVKIGDGAWAPKGVDGARWCADRLSERIDAPVSIDGIGFELAESIVFDLDSSVLKAVWAVLAPYGWFIRIDGRGEVHICEKPKSESLILDHAGSCVLIPGTDYDEDTRTYSREWYPDVTPFSLVRASIPAYGLDGLYEVKSQRLVCARGVVVEESVKAVNDA